MKTRLIVSEDELLVLKDSWNQLVRDNPETDMPFFSWDWFHRSWFHFGRPAGQTLSVVVAEESQSGRLLGVLPLIAVKKKSNGISYKSLEFCATGIMPRNTAYFAVDADPDAVFHALTEKLFEERTRWDMLEWVNVPETTAFHRFLLDDAKEKNARRKRAQIRWQGFIAPQIEIEGTVEDYLSSLGRSTRKDLRKHLRRFENLEKERRFLFFEKPEEIDEGLRYLFEVRRHSWKGEFASEHSKSFYREIARILSERGEVLVAVALIDEIPMSAGFVVVQKNAYMTCINDFNPEFRDLAPGMMLFLQELEHMLQTGRKIYDFCGTVYDYKDRLAKGRLGHSTFQLFHGGLKSRFLYKAKTSWLPMLRKILRKPDPGDMISHFAEY